MAKFSERLRELRKSKDMSQNDLANALSLSRSCIGMYEQGQREPDFETQEAIADYFNVNLDYLRGKSESSKDWEKLINAYAELDNNKKTSLIAYAEFLLSTNTNTLRGSDGE